MRLSSEWEIKTVIADERGFRLNREKGGKIPLISKEDLEQYRFFDQQMVFAKLLVEKPKCLIYRVKPPQGLLVLKLTRPTASAAAYYVRVTVQRGDKISSFFPVVYEEFKLKVEPHLFFVNEVIWQGRSTSGWSEFADDYYYAPPEEEEKVLSLLQEVWVK